MLLRNATRLPPGMRGSMGVHPAHRTPDDGICRIFGSAITMGALRPIPIRDCGFWDWVTGCAPVPVHCT